MKDTRTSALENRIPPPLLMAAVGAAMWIAPLGPAIVGDPWRVFFAVPLAFTAFAIAGLGVLEFRRARTTIDPVDIGRAATVVRNGIYRITRNPMYVGMVTLLLAWAIWLNGWALLLGPVAFFLFIDNFQIRPEERAMARNFGRDYEDYCTQVRRWI